MEDMFLVSLIEWIEYRKNTFDLNKSNDELIIEARAMLPASTNMMVNNDLLSEAFNAIRVDRSIGY